MATFNWLGGSMDQALSWGPQPDPKNPVVPGLNDFALIGLNGTLSGGLSVIQATLSAVDELAGSITTSGFVVETAGTLTVDAGAMLTGHGLDMLGGQIVQNGGTVTIGAAHEFIADAPGSVAGYTQNGGTHTIAGDLSLGNSGTGTFTLTGGSFSSVAEFMGQNGTGTFTQTGGTHTVSDRIVLGIDQTGGVGAAGSGTYTLGGTGQLTVQTIFIGSDPDCSGEFDFNRVAGDAAKLSISGTGGFPGLIVAGEGTGTFTQGHGSLSTTIAVGFRATGDGTLTHENGLLTSKDEEVGVAGHGLFVQEGGTNKVIGTGLVLGVLADAVGTYDLQGGSVDAVRLVVGNSGSGTLTQSAGTLTARLVVAALGGSTGDATLAGGTLTANGEVVGGQGTATFSQTGGAHQVKTGDLVVGQGSGGDGSFALHSGSLTITAGDLVLGSAAGATGDFSFNAGPGDDGTLDLVAGTLVVGDGGAGSFTLGGGDLVASLTLGAQTGSEGTFDLNGGSLTATDGDEVVGSGGTATFTQRTGTNTVQSGGLFIGEGGGDGTYTLGGDASLVVTAGMLTLGGAGGSTGTFLFNTTAGDAAGLSIDTRLITVGDHGSASFIQGGGTINAKLVVGGQTGSHGAYELDGGMVSAAGQVIGNNGNGGFTQNGGTNKITGGGDLMLGAFSLGLGTYDLIKGKLTDGGALVGYEGAGSFTQTGGSHAIAGKGALLDLGVKMGAQGVYTLAAGSLKALHEVVGDAGTGTFAQKGGVNTVAGAGSKLEIGVAGHGSYQLTLGHLNATQEMVGETGVGKFIQKGGINTLTGVLDMGEGTGGTGAYTLTKGKLAAGTEVVGDAGHGTFAQHGGSNTLTGDLVIGKASGGAGSYDLTGGSLVIKDATGTAHTLWLGQDAAASGEMTISAAKVSTPYLHLGHGGLTVEAGGVMRVLHQVQIDSGTLDASAGAMVIGRVKTPVVGEIAIGAGGMLTGAGTVDGTLREGLTATVTAQGGTLTLTGDLTGAGHVQIADGAVLDLQGHDALGLTFLGAAGVLRLEKTAVVAGTIGQMVAGDVIDLVGVAATHAKLHAGKLTVTESDGSSVVLHVAGALMGNHFAIAPDGAGGSALILTAPAPLADHFAFATAGGSAEGQAWQPIAAPVPDLPAGPCDSGIWPDDMAGLLPVESLML